MKIKRSGMRDYLLIGVVLIATFLLFLIPFSPIGTAVPGQMLRGTVVSADNSGLVRHGLVLYGSQKLIVESGNRRLQAANELRGQVELDKVFAPGDRIVLTAPPGALSADSFLTAQDFYRNFWSVGLFLLFCALLCWFGGLTGVKALLSFVFSCVVIWKLVIPLVLMGLPASWLIFGIVCLLTGVIIFLVAGLTRKGVAAFGGAIAGVFAGLLMAHVFGRLMHVNGNIMPYVQTLLYSGYENLNISDIFIGAMVLASSGAVMDLAMDIASGVEEVALHNPDLPAKELIRSGIRIGRSVTGTMTTTLLLAYSGGYLTLLMMFAAQGTPVALFLNSNLVASELMKTLIGSFSIVLVAPLTAVVSGLIFAGKQKIDPDSE